MSRISRLALIAGASLLVGGVPAVVAAQGAGAATPTLSITFPVEGAKVGAGQLDVTATLAGAAGDKVSAVYAIDVSGSTSAAGYDCSGEGLVSTDDDLNGDGAWGETLDCEIAGGIALNGSLAALPDSVSRLEVGVVAFGDTAAALDVSGAKGVQELTAPLADQDGDRDRAADVVQSLGSLDQGVGGLYDNRVNVGLGTNFDAALNEAARVLAPATGRKVVFLLTDGHGSLSDATLAQLKAEGVEVRPYGVTQGSDQCVAGGALDRIAKAGGTTCTFVPNPSSLAAVISGQPASITGATVQLDGQPVAPAQVDALGTIGARVTVAPGAHTLTVRVAFADGTSSSTTNRFTATGDFGYVALGDSYSAGEGVTPFADVPAGSGGACHQSTRGYGALVGTAGYDLPGKPKVRRVYVACSGAVLKNLLSVPQKPDGWEHPPQLESVSNDAALVTFTIGGNDLGFSQIGAHCATQIHCYNAGYATLTSGRSLSLDEFVRIRLALLRPELQAFYRVLRGKAPDATILALGYPEPVDDGIALRLGCKEAALLDRAERQWLNGFADTLDQGIADSAAAAGIWAEKPDFRGHRLCEGGVNDNGEYIVGHEAVYDFKHTQGRATFHPNVKGQAKYARTVVDFLERTIKAGGPLTAAGLPANPTPVAPAAAARVAGAGAASLAQGVAARGAATFAAASGIDSLTTQELTEVASMTFSDVEVQTLGQLRGDADCNETAVLGEQLVVSSSGFASGSKVRLELKSDSEADPRSYRTEFVADSRGSIRASVVVPPDLASSTELRAVGSQAAVRVELDGHNPGGGQHRASTVVDVELPDSACMKIVTSRGDVSDGAGPAPSATQLPGLPALATPVASAVWADGTDGGIRISGSKVTVTSAMHSNDGVSVRGSQHRLVGGVTSVERVKLSGRHNIVEPAPVRAAARSGRPSLQVGDLLPGGQRARSFGQQYHVVGDADCRDGTATLDVVDGASGVWYVPCNVEIRARKVKATITIVAEGRATVQAREATLLPFTSEVVAASHGRGAKLTLSASRSFIGGLQSDRSATLEGKRLVVGCGLYARNIRVAGERITLQNRCTP